MKEENRRCRLCNLGQESLEHIYEKCEYTRQKEKRWTNILKGGRENLAAMQQVRWTKGRIEKEREMESRREGDIEDAQVA